MHQQDGQEHRNTIPDINISIIRLSQKGADDRKEETHHQDRKDELIGGADTLIVRAGA